jgi:hypothetical protein
MQRDGISEAGRLPSLPIGLAELEEKVWPDAS